MQVIRSSSIAFVLYYYAVVRKGVEGWVNVRVVKRPNTNHVFPNVATLFFRRDGCFTVHGEEDPLIPLPLKNTGDMRYHHSQFYLLPRKRSFTPILHLSSSSSSSSSTSNKKNNNKNNNNDNNQHPKKESKDYSDDFFGLIFLGSAVGLHDAVFATIFLILSFVGAIVGRQQSSYKYNDNFGCLDNNNNNKDNVKLLPGTVAFLSLGLSLVVKLVLQAVAVKMPIETSPVAMDTATLATEAIACAASFIYTTFLSSRSSKEQNEDSSKVS